MRIVYPAVIHEDPDGLWLEFPDLEGCGTQGDSQEELLFNASEALECYALGVFENGGKLPAPRSPSSIHTDGSCYVSLICADIDLAKNTKSVKKTLTIPSWLNDRALAEGLNFSRVLQAALLKELKLV